MANSEKIDDLIDEKAFKQLDDLLLKLGVAQSKFSETAKSAIELNNAIGNSKGISEFKKAQEDAVVGIDKTIKAQENARLAEIKLQLAREKAFDNYEKKLQKQIADENKKTKTIISNSQEEIDASSKNTGSIISNTTAINENNKKSAEAANLATTMSSSKAQVTKSTTQYVDELSKEETQLKNNIRSGFEMKIQLSALENQQKENKKEFESGAISAANYAEKSAKIGLEASVLKNAISQNTLEISRQSKELSLSETSDASKSVRLERLRTAYRELSEEEKNNIEVGGQLQDQIIKLDTELKKSDKAIGVNTRSVGDYKLATNGLKQSFLDLVPGARGVNDALVKGGGIFSNLKTVLTEYIVGTKVATVSTEGLSIAQKAAAIASNIAAVGLKVLRVALISTGIGAIIVLLGSLIAYFATTQTGIDAVTSVTRPLVAIFKSFLGVAQTLGEKLANMLTSPKKAFVDFANFFKENIINRFKAFAVIYEGIINKDFKKVANGFLQAGSGVENLIDKTKKATEVTSKFFSEAANKGSEIDRIQKEIEQRQIDLIDNEIKYNDEIDKQLLIAKNISLSKLERKKAAEEIVATAQKQGEEEAKIVQLKIDQLKTEQSLNDTDREGFKEMALLRKELDEANDKGLAKRIELSRILFAADKEADAKKLAGIKATTDAEKLASEQLLDLEIQRQNRIAELAGIVIDEEKNGYEDRLNNVETYYTAKKIVLDKEYEKEKLNTELSKTELKKLEEKYNNDVVDLANEKSKKIIEVYKSNLSVEEKLRLETNEKILKKLEIQRDQEILDLQNAEAEANAKGLGNKEKFENDKLNIQKKYAELAIQEQIKQVEAFIALEKKRGNDTTNAEAELLALKIKNSNEIVTATTDDAKKRAEVAKQLKDKLIQLAQDTFNLIGTLISQNYDNKINAVDGEIEKLNSKADFDKKQVEDSLLTADEKAIKLAEIDARRAFEEEQLEKKKRKLIREQAIFQKAINVANIIQATALAVAAQLVIPGAGIGLAITVGAIGAVQLATVLATPLPAFKDGGTMKKDGLALFGEVGNELRIDPSGAISLTPDKPTIGEVKAGTKFISNKDLLNMISKPQLNMIENNRPDNKEVVKVLGEIKEKLNSGKTTTSSINITKSGWSKTNKENNQWTTYINENF